MSVAFTRTLAVNLEAITRPREFGPFTYKAVRKYADTRKDAEKLIESLTKVFRVKSYEEIAVCSEK